MTTYIHTTFEDNQKAREAVQALLDAGFPTQDISLAQKEDTQFEAKPLRHRTYAFRTGGIGAAIGTLLGSAFALAVPALSTDITLIEAFEAMLSSSPVVAALEGGFLGAIGGGFLGIVAGIGAWKQEPAFDEGADCVRVGVHTQQGRAERAIAALKQLGARNIESTQR